MPLFRKQPVVIEAHQVPPEGEVCGEEMAKFLSEAPGVDNLGDGSLVIDNEHGQVTAAPGDWVIRGVKGEYYPCNPEVFAETYAPAEIINGNVVAFPAKQEPPPVNPELVESIRGLLTRAEKGEVSAYVIAIKDSDGGISFGTAVVPWDAITMSALLHDHMIQLMRTHGLAPRT